MGIVCEFELELDGPYRVRLETVWLGSIQLTKRGSGCMMWAECCSGGLA